MSSLAAIHVGRKQLGLDEETYRAMLCRVTGKSSAKDMSEGERAAVVREMRRCGFKPSLRDIKKGIKGSFNKGKKARSGLYRKLQALWIAGWNLGVVRDRTDKGLDGFIARKCGGVEVQAVEALKGWLGRETLVDWGGTRYYCDEERVAAAQWLMLCELTRGGLAVRPDRKCKNGEVYRPGGFMAAIQGIVGRSRSEMRAQDWHEVMNELGERLRHLKELRREQRPDDG